MLSPALYIHTHTQIFIAINLDTSPSSLLSWSSPSSFVHFQIILIIRVSPSLSLAPHIVLLDNVVSQEGVSNLISSSSSFFFDKLWWTNHTFLFHQKHKTKSKKRCFIILDHRIRYDPQKILSMCFFFVRCILRQKTFKTFSFDVFLQFISD